MECSLNFTDAAKLKLQQIAKQYPHQYVRISAEGFGCAGQKFIFSLDTELQEDDIKIHTVTDGLAVVLQPQLAALLNGSTIDYKQDLSGSRFIIRDNPNAIRSCKCGSSFGF